MGDGRAVPCSCRLKKDLDMGIQNNKSSEMVKEQRNEERGRSYGVSRREQGG